MVRIEFSVGVYEDHLASIIRWYTLANKDKHPTKEDERTFNLFRVLYEDLARDNKEEIEYNRDD